MLLGAHKIFDKICPFLSSDVGAVDFSAVTYRYKKSRFLHGKFQEQVDTTVSLVPPILNVQITFETAILRMCAFQY